MNKRRVVRGAYFGVCAFIVGAIGVGFAGSVPIRAQSVTSTEAPTTSASATATEGGYLGAVTNATTNGAVVIQVLPGSPAEAAALQVGDVIQSVNGEVVDMTTPLSALLRKLSPGATALFIVARGNGWLPVQITLSVRPTPTATPVLTNTLNSTKSPNSRHFGIGLGFDGTN